MVLESKIIPGWSESEHFVYTSKFATLTNTNIQDINVQKLDSLKDLIPSVILTMAPDVEKAFGLEKGFLGKNNSKNEVKKTLTLTHLYLMQRNQGCIRSKK